MKIIIENCQSIMRDYLVPDGLSKDEFISKIIFELDNPEQRAMQAPEKPSSPDAQAAYDALHLMIEWVFGIKPIPQDDDVYTARNRIIKQLKSPDFVSIDEKMDTNPTVHKDSGALDALEKLVAEAYALGRVESDILDEYDDTVRQALEQAAPVVDVDSLRKKALPPEHPQCDEVMGYNQALDDVEALQPVDFIHLMDTLHKYEAILDYYKKLDKAAGVKNSRAAKALMSGDDKDA